MAEAVFNSKKEQIFDLFSKAPTMSNADIANHTMSSVSYVSRLLGPNRVTNPLNQKQVNSLNRKANSMRLQREVWSQFRESQQDFVRTYLPQHKYKNEATDFSYFLPTDDSFANSGSGVDFSGSWSQYLYLAEKRIGIGPKITKACAEDAVREGFQFLDVKSREVVERDKIFEWVKNTDLINELAKVIYFERVFGIGFLISYYGKNDKKEGILGTEQKPGKKPIAFEALPPTVLSPQNVYLSDRLDKNPQKWDLIGGINDPQVIDHTRVRVFMSREVIGRWYGLSMFEPIWDSVIPYYQALIFLLKGFSKWGNHVPEVIIPEDDTVEAVFDKHIDVVEDMKQNGTFIFPRGTELKFTNTQLATGLRELIEIWLEDISAGTGVPVAIMMGRVVSAGLGGMGYLVAERNYWNNEKKIQLAFTDDVTAIIKFAGFKMDKQEINWHLAVTKTDQQRLMDEGMELENEIMKERLIQEKVMTDNMLAEGIGGGEDGDKDKENGKDKGKDQKGKKEPVSKPGNGGAKKLAQQRTDFIVDRIRKRRLEIMKQLNLPLGGR